MRPQPGTPEIARGTLIVRASGAAAASAAISGLRAASPANIQLLMRCTVPVAVAETGTTFSFADCTLHVQPVEQPKNGARGRTGAVMLTVASAKLSVTFAELRPLMFQPVVVEPPLRAVFSSAIANVLAAADTLDPHGLAHHLLGLAELVLRSALRAELDRVDALTARRRAAEEYMREQLSDPGLSADQIADALFISRRRLYQLFDDGEGVSGRIRALRIERAKALLGDPAKAARGIGEISKDCGFASSAHFSRTFRKLVGSTPKDFRDRALQS